MIFHVNKIIGVFQTIDKNYKYKFHRCVSHFTKACVIHDMAGLLVYEQ